ncbi:AIR synthase family protein [Aedoeadaptatus pacaensis]|uniref:AIR synthase family protein n=1 Tax=Aedoeadaptatus pacaensis TaxID=1776390 RepID=UPI000837B3D1|nr:AIR synthase family protein [Peptoniphilus pacaensis]
MRVFKDVGKLSNEDLDALILSKLKSKRKEVLCASSIGEDTALLDMEGDYIVLSSDPITGAAENLGALAIHISVNDVATKSADAVGVLLTLLLPVNTSSKEIETIMADAQRAADEVNMDIIGGHTEITDAVSKPVMISTVIGRVAKEHMPDSDAVKPGDVVAMSKVAGLEGTAIICTDCADALKDMGEELLSQGQELMNELSVQKEGEVAAGYHIRAMHDVTEGGVEGALWEMARALGVGMCIEKEAIPVLDSTRALAEIADIDLYRLISSGSMLVVMDRNDFEPMRNELEERSILFTKIGEITDDFRVIYKNGDGEEAIPSPGPDELYGALLKLQ